MSNVPSFSREQDSIESIDSFFANHADYVLSLELQQLAIPAGAMPRLIERPCPVCGQRYLTSTSERLATCSDCPMDAREARARARKVVAEVVRRRDEHRNWAWQQCLMGERGACDHARGICLLLEADATAGPAF